LGPFEGGGAGGFFLKTKKVSFFFWKPIGKKFWGFGGGGANSGFFRLKIWGGPKIFARGGPILNYGAPHFGLLIILGSQFKIVEKKRKRGLGKPYFVWQKTFFFPN